MMGDGGYRLPLVSPAIQHGSGFSSSPKPILPPLLHSQQRYTSSVVSPSVYTPIFPSTLSPLLPHHQITPDTGTGSQMQYTSVMPPPSTTHIQPKHQVPPQQPPPDNQSVPSSASNSPNSKEAARALVSVYESGFVDWQKTRQDVGGAVVKLEEIDNSVEIQQQETDENREEEDEDMPTTQQGRPRSQKRKRASPSSSSTSLSKKTAPPASISPPPTNNTSSTSPTSKRQLFLERNRQAASKCRQKKKQKVAELESTYNHLTQQNEQLAKQAAELRDSVLELKALLLNHRFCAVAKKNGIDMQAIEGTLTSTLRKIVK
ncbi:hypothetical protein HDV05_005035 [Chytridiales sp. JEL 0842]|nr:hypothetical protein HDV05_005035 [Chytridiales sp. JEL 0842]